MAPSPVTRGLRPQALPSRSAVPLPRNPRFLPRRSPAPRPSRSRSWSLTTAVRASPASTVTVTVNPPAAGNTQCDRQHHLRARAVRNGSAGSEPWPLVCDAGPATSARRHRAGPERRARSTVLATGSTDDLGNYTLSVAANTTITIEVVARMLRDASQPLPRWDVRVQDGTTGNNPYAYTEPRQFQFQRRYRAQRRDSHRHQCRRRGHGHARLRAVRDPRHGVPGHPDHPRGRADHQLSRADRRLGQPDPLERSSRPETRSTSRCSPTSPKDTDEFDQHVIAHEFGHYIENNFSRADNIGGSHGLGDKLDPRVAFGEGFGYAFAAIVLNDPVARDSVRLTTAIHGPSAFNIETNPPTTPVGAQRQLRLLVQRVVGVVDSLGSVRQRGRRQRQRCAGFRAASGMC